MAAAIREMTFARLAAAPCENIAGYDIEVQSLVMRSINQEVKTVLD
jgi:hypothetical protein